MRSVHERGQEWQAEKLTGARAQKGNLPGGTPRWTYEVQWKGAFPNTWEPATNLIGWEKEMKVIDEKVAITRLLPKVNPAAEALKARETAAKLKQEELQARRVCLLRLQSRMGTLQTHEARVRTVYG